MNKDPRHLGIPNINFTLTKDNDPREEVFQQQRLERGFDDSETFCLTSTMVRFIYPRLIAYQEKAEKFIGTPKFNKKLKKIVKAFKILYDDCEKTDGMRCFSDKQWKQINKGLDLFREYFFALWW